MRMKKEINLQEKNTDYKDKYNHEYFMKRLSELLHEHNMTQADLAKHLDILPVQVTRWKTNQIKTAVPYKQIKKISELFSVDPQWLYDPDYGHRDALADYLADSQKREEQFRSEQQPLIDYLESLGYTIVSNGNGTLLISTEPHPTTDSWPDGYRKLDDKLIKRLQLITTYTLLG